MKEALLSANSNISHYRILSKLGAGGMGEVSLAADTPRRRKVTRKLLAHSFIPTASGWGVLGHFVRS